jgi:membrane protease YdiL (CAAX protease family)
MSQRAHLVTAQSEQPFREVAKFVAVTFLITTTVYLPQLAKDLGLISVTLPPRAGLNVVGTLSPGIATLLISLYDDGVDGVRGIFGGLAAWRFGLGWWVVTLAIPPVFFAVLAGAVIILGQNFSPEPLRILSEFGAGFVLLILIAIVLSAGEEIGWRGHLLPLLQERLSALSASLVLGVVWAVWHLPVFYGAGIEGWVLAVRLLSIPAGAVMYTWLFNNTGGSVLAVTLFHAGTNLWVLLLAPMLTGDPAATVFTLENIVAAVVLIGIYGRETLTDHRLFRGR